MISDLVHKNPSFRDALISVFKAAQEKETANSACVSIDHESKACREIDNVRISRKLSAFLFKEIEDKVAAINQAAVELNMALNNHQGLGYRRMLKQGDFGIKSSDENGYQAA